MNKHIKTVVLLLIFISATVSLFVLLNQGYKKHTLYFQAVKWSEGAVPDNFIEVSNQPFKYDLISLARDSANSGPIIIGESSSIWKWVEEIIEESPFDMVDIKISDNEFYNITFR